MNTPIEISSLADYINQIDEITCSEKSYLYRGQENEFWRVTSSAYRRLASSAKQVGMKIDTSPDSVRLLCRNYLVKIVDEIKLRHPSTYRNLAPLECIAHLQHNRVATGLIDFTFSPLVALWFACADESVNGKVFVLENDSAEIEEVTTIKMLQEELDVLFSAGQARWYLWSPTLDSQVVETQRMLAQQSAFLFGLPEVNTEIIAQEIVILRNSKARLRVELEKMGILEETLFSDLLGFFERNTATHYYHIELDEFD